MRRFGLHEDECFWHGVRLSRQVLSLRVSIVACTGDGWLQMLSLWLGDYGEKANIPCVEFALPSLVHVHVSNGSAIRR